MTEAEVPAKGSRWIYDGREVVVIGVRTIVDWEYVDDRHNWNNPLNGELRCFTGPFPAFTPVPIEVKAGQTWEYDDNIGQTQKPFVIGEIFEGWAYGRIGVKRIYSGGEEIDWNAAEYNVNYLVTSKFWHLKEES